MFLKKNEISKLENTLGKEGIAVLIKGIEELATITEGHISELSKVIKFGPDNVTTVMKLSTSIHREN